MQELYTLILNAPSFIQVAILVFALIGCYIVYRFRVIVGIISAGAIAIWLSMKNKKG